MKVERVTRHIPNTGIMSDGVAIVSGGMDSVTLVHHLLDEGRRPHLISFDYGQRHRKELQYALWTAEALGLHWSLVDLSSITDLIASSALTSSVIPVPEGHYAEDNMAITVVPNRNMMMISIAAAIAVSNGASYVALGIHAGDHAQYPDCRFKFLQSCEKTIKAANEGFIHDDFELLAPFVDRSKADIAYRAWELKVPIEKTWSCYAGAEYHCGRCATCVERLEAVDEASQRAGVLPAEWDHTTYQDIHFWREVVAEYKANQQ